VARYCRASLLASTALAVAMSCAAGRAHAQASAGSFTSSGPQAPAQVSVRDSQGETRDPSVPSLFDPHFEERDGRAQRFRKPGAVATVSSGAGTTGFDATHSRARRKARADAQKRARAEAENLPPLVPSGPDRTVAPYSSARKVGRQHAGARSTPRPLRSMRPAPSQRVRSAGASSMTIRSRPSASIAAHFW